MDDVELVRAYVEASQKARASHLAADFDAVRHLLADDVDIRMASAWTDAPWRTVITGADAVVSRLQAPINTSTSLTTENVNVVQAGPDVLVEQLSTITRDGTAHVSMVCHILTVEDGRISRIRSYRNDVGLPPG